ncbi:MAG: hypothetical protein GWM98_04715 [Nitrospinaceae bacterium]|nr:hypothetical protein [Deltaproteobacteria bacterium]NIY14222.1 hypothetical protein [Nitrospinaceae bacterium]
MIVRELVATLGIKTDPRSFKKADSSLKGVVKGIRNVAIAAVSAWATIRGGFKLIELASDAKETLNVIDAAFKDNKQTVLDWSKTFAKTAGRSTNDMREMAATLGAVLNPLMDGNSEQAAKMSTRLSELAVDLGSFYNAAEPDVLQALRAGLTGEAEPLKRFGVVMNQDTLAAFALSRGIQKNVKDMSIAEKTALRYAFIVDVTSQAHGDAAKTSEGWANASKALRAKIKDIATALGAKLLPHAEKVVNAFKDWIEEQGGAEAVAEILIKRIEDFWKQGQNLLRILRKYEPLIAGIVAAWVAYKVALKAVMVMNAIKWILTFGKTLKIAAAAQALLNAVMTANPIGLIIVGIGALIAAIVWLIANWDLVGPKIDEVVQWFLNGIDNMIAIFKPWVDKLIGGIKGIWNWFLKMLDNPFFAAAASIVAPWLTLPALIIKHWESVKSFFVNLWATLKKGVDWLLGVWDKLTKVGGWLDQFWGVEPKGKGKPEVGPEGPQLQVTPSSELAGGLGVLMEAAEGPQSVLPPTAGPGRGAGANISNTQHNEMNITVNPSAGMDERALADLVQDRVSSEMEKQNQEVVEDLSSAASGGLGL